MEYEEDLNQKNWELVRISRINDEMIEKLINNLQSPISEDFFISFESLIKIGWRAKEIISSSLKENKELSTLTRNLLVAILEFIDAGRIDPILVQLYHPDFICRARAIHGAEMSKNQKYTGFILPLIEDPDDSVRWAAMNYLLDHPSLEIILGLEKHLETESNPVISRKIQARLENESHYH